jgi:molybdopterin converting factor small subunit
MPVLLFAILHLPAPTGAATCAGSGTMRRMQVMVEAHPPYRAGLGGGRFPMELPDGSTLRDLLRQLAQHSRDFGPFAAASKDEWLWGQLLVHARGEIVRLDEALQDGECVELLPPIAGGSQP